MRTSALQEFVRSLGGSLAAVGVQQRSLDDLRAVAQVLEPFRDLDLEQLADFFRRANEFRQSGDVPAVAVHGLDDTAGAARKLNEAIQAMGTTDAAGGAAGIEHHVTQSRHAFQTAVATLTGQFGGKVTFTDNTRWLPELRSKATVSRTVDAFRHLASRVTGPESYQDQGVVTDIESLATGDAKALTAAVKELGVVGSGKGRKLVASVLGKLTGIEAKPARAEKKAKAEKPTATEAQVEEMAQTLQGMVARAQDPAAVSDSEIDAILNRVSTEFSDAQQKALAARVTGKGGRSAKEAIERLRADLTAVKRLLDSQKV